MYPKWVGKLPRNHDLDEIYAYDYPQQNYMNCDYKLLNLVI